MTTVAVLCDPPETGSVLAGLADYLDEEAVTSLYQALLRDSCLAVERSGGELLVNYRETDPSAEQTVRSIVKPVLRDPDAVRFERQVGSTFAARAGNTATHLLEREQHDSVAITTPEALLLDRQLVDTAAMRLRQSPVVLGPATDGRVYYAGFTEPIDFTDAYEPPAIETLTERATAATLDVTFLPQTPLLERPSDVPGAVALLRARQTAGRQVPQHTMAAIDDLDLSSADSLDDR